MALPEILLPGRVSPAPAANGNSKLLPDRLHQLLHFKQPALLIRYTQEVDPSGKVFYRDLFGMFSTQQSPSVGAC